MGTGTGWKGTMGMEQDTRHRGNLLVEVRECWWNKMKDSGCIVCLNICSIEKMKVGLEVRKGQL